MLVPHTTYFKLYETWQ